jgi:hypothetical protein
MALHIRESKRDKSEVADEGLLGQLCVKVLELQNDPKGTCCSCNELLIRTSLLTK